jgi:hypothetical protein
MSHRFCRNRPVFSRIQARGPYAKSTEELVGARCSGQRRPHRQPGNGGGAPGASCAPAGALVLLRGSPRSAGHGSSRGRRSHDFRPAGGSSAAGKGRGGLDTSRRARGAALIGPRRVVVAWPRVQAVAAAWRTGGGTD